MSLLEDMLTVQEMVKKQLPRKKVIVVTQKDFDKISEVLIKKGNKYYDNLGYEIIKVK